MPEKNETSKDLCLDVNPAPIYRIQPNLLDEICKPLPIEYYHNDSNRKSSLGSNRFGSPWEKYDE